ncbi:MAG: HAD family hydrolase [Kiritimatiellales bacterium]
MASKKTIVALMYDFDKTLCTKDMQEYSFIPKVGMKADDFWEESNALSHDEKMDQILAYMYLMICKANAANQSIRRKDFVDAGKAVEFYPGVEDWFDRINAFGISQHVHVEHYIISSGLREIIEGTPLRKKFEKIYASEFHYNASGAADWPKLAINFTAKTQFLFRINKGVLDISQSNELNEYVPDHARRVPFSHMIYIGDGLTDVPCMKLVKLNGGKSIAVFPPRKRAKVANLLKDKRVDFITEANYSIGSEMEKIVQEIITKIAATNILVQRHQKQMGTLK